MTNDAAIDSAFAALPRSARGRPASRGHGRRPPRGAARLLDEAVGFHQQHGEEATCPVCGTTDVLDTGWLIRSQAEIEELRRRSEDLRVARLAVGAAQHAIDALFPAILGSVDDDGVRAAWARWSAVAREGDDGRDAAFDGAATAASAREAAEHEAERRQSAWGPIQADVASWVATARRAEHDKETVVTLKGAEVGRAACTARFVPSGPTPGPGQLGGAPPGQERRPRERLAAKEGNRRYAAFAVQGRRSRRPALGVMSQGELHAMAVGLPAAGVADREPVPAPWSSTTRSSRWTRPRSTASRACSPTRPPRPARSSSSPTTSGCPRPSGGWDIDARIMNVHRRASSKVEVVAGRPPSDRYVGEAFAFAKTLRTSPTRSVHAWCRGWCRSAIEAACAARIRRRLIDSGTPRCPRRGAPGRRGRP